MTTRTNDAARNAGGKKRNGLKTGASKAVKKNADAIAECLVKSAKNGDVKSARLLLELSEGDEGVEEAKKDRPLLSLAARLAAEPQWPIDVPEEDWDEDVDAEMEVEGTETVTA
jgi:hypothetical protein